MSNKDIVSIFDFEDLDGYKKDLDKRLSKYKSKIDDRTYKELKNMFSDLTNDVEKLENYNSYVNNILNTEEDNDFDPEEDPIDFLFDCILNNMELDYEDYIRNNCEDLTKTEAFHIFSVIHNHLEAIDTLFSLYMMVDFEGTLKNNSVSGIDSKINDFDMKDYKDFEIFIPRDVRKTNSVALYLYRNDDRNIDDAISFHFVFDNIFNPLYLTHNNPWTFLRLDHKNVYIEGFLRDVVKSSYNIFNFEE